MEFVGMTRKSIKKVSPHSTLNDNSKTVFFNETSKKVSRFTAAAAALMK